MSKVIKCGKDNFRSWKILLNSCIIARNLGYITRWAWKGWRVLGEKMENVRLVDYGMDNNDNNDDNDDDEYGANNSNHRKVNDKDKR